MSGHDEAGSSGSTIEIKIKTMDSQTYTLEVDKQMAVPALKERIATVTGVVREHQRLICRGKVLKDDQLLSAYHVEDGHTLHLVVREPTASSSSSSGNLLADPAVDWSSSGNHGQFYQVAPGIVVETFNMPGQGDRALPEVNRIISAVLGSMGISNPSNGNEGTGIRDQVGDRLGETAIQDGTTDQSRAQPEQTGMRSSNNRSRLHNNNNNNTFGIPAGFSFGSLQAPVIPDALTTLSQYLSHMSQEFTDNGRSSENESGVAARGNEEESASLEQSDNIQAGLPSPASLAQLLSSTRQILNQQVQECLLQLERQLENHENIADSAARATAQAGALRNGILIQNLGAYFLELGRTISTLRLGRSPSESVVNAGPAVFISSSGPNPLMVQPLPFQPGTSFGTPLSGTSQSNSGLMNGGGSSFVPRRIDIQIRRVGPSTPQSEVAGSRQSSGQANSRSNGSGEAPANQSSSNSGGGVRLLPLRTMMGAVPDLSRSTQDSLSGSLGFLYPVLGRYSSMSSGNLSNRTENQVADENLSGGVQTRSNNSPESAEGSVGNGRGPANGPGQGDSISSRTIDINILSTGGIQSDQNSDRHDQIPPGIFQFLRGMFPGGDFQVESVSSHATGNGVGSVSDQDRTDNTAPQEAEPIVTEEGLFLSSLLQQIMPLISDNSEGNTSQEENTEIGTSRRGDDYDVGPNPKRQKRE